MMFSIVAAVGSRLCLLQPTVPAGAKPQRAECLSETARCVKGTTIQLKPPYCM